MIINQFIKEYEYLSIYSPFNLELYGMTFPTLEHYYYAFKCNCIEIFKDLLESPQPEKFLNDCDKKYNKRFRVIREDWIDVRADILRYGVYRKFSEEPHRSKLLDLPKDTEFIFGFTDPRPSEDKSFLGESLVTCDGCNMYGKYIALQKSYIDAQNAHQSLNSTYLPTSTCVSCST